MAVSPGAEGEATHFQLDPEDVGDLRGARVTIYSHGWESTYRI